MLFPCGWPWFREGSPACGAEGAGCPLDRRSRERECGCSLSPRLPQSFLPGTQDPIPHPHSMLHALSSSRCRAHLPDMHTCIHCLPHHHVCVWALGCQGFASRQAGLCLPRGMGRGSGRVRHWSTHQWPPPPSRSCTPPSLPPSAMPASRTHGVLGSSQRQDMGLHPGAGLCNSHPQQT